jgi:rhamnulokinase
MRHFLAIDLGASSGRAIVGSLEGKKLSLREIHRFENGGTLVNGRLVWNLLGLFQEIKTGIRKAVDEKIDIAGIGVDTWGVDFALIDAQGNFLGFPFHYRDQHTADVFDWVFDQVPRETFYDETGIQFMAINTIFQLATMKRNQSPALANASRMLMMPNALTYMLCGDISAEQTIASTTEAYSPVTKDWAWELIDRLGLPRHLFPPIKPPCTVAGQLNADICRELNCPPIPVILVGSHDTASAVASIPASPTDHDWAFLSSGTWSLLGVELDEPLLTDQALQANFTNEGGIAEKIRFLKNIMGLWLVQECRNTWRRQGNEYSFSELGRLAAQAPAFQSLVDPNDESFAAPGDMPTRIQDYCRRTGQAAPESVGEIIRCAEQSLALRYRQCIEQLESLTGKPISRLHLVGGGSQDELLNQFTANAINRPVITGPVEATAAGNILCQAMATKDLADLAAAREVVQASFETRQYLPREAGLWAEAYKKFTAVAERGKSGG